MVWSAVKAFDHLRAAGPQAQYESAVSKVVQGEGAHGSHCRRPGGGLHDARGKFDLAGFVCQIGQRCQRVAPPRFSGKGHVDAKLLGKLHPLYALAERPGSDGPYFNGKFQGGVGLRSGDAVQRWQQILQKSLGVFTHGKMPNVFHFLERRAGNCLMSGLPQLRGAATVIFC